VSPKFVRIFHTVLAIDEIRSYESDADANTILVTLKNDEEMTFGFDDEAQMLYTAEQIDSALDVAIAVPLPTEES
jgi:hypothetical protein